MPLSFSAVGGAHSMVLTGLHTADSSDTNLGMEKVVPVFVKYPEGWVCNYYKD